MKSGGGFFHMEQYLEGDDLVLYSHIAADDTDSFFGSSDVEAWYRIRLDNPAEFVSAASQWLDEEASGTDRTSALDLVRRAFATEKLLTCGELAQWAERHGFAVETSVR